MSRILILGAAGSLGKQVTRQAVAANHEVSTVVRNPTKLPADLREKVVLHQTDLATAPETVLATLFRDHEVVINTAGFVTEGQAFVDLVDRIVTGLDSLPDTERPVCWFLAGAALLDLDDRGRRGVDLPRIAETYWPHRVNFDRIRQTALDWRILCPGPMVDQPPLGLERLRISLDRVPVSMPPTKMLPGVLVLPFFASRIPEMIISYADAAALMLANLAPSGEMSRHRVGVALPAGMRGEKPQ
jgi:putative NADH-flavin reductase